MGNTASLGSWSQLPGGPSVASGLINASLPAISVGLEAESRGGTSHAAIGDVQSARRASVSLAIMETQSQEEVVPFPLRAFRRGFDHVLGGALRISESCHDQLQDRGLLGPLLAEYSLSLARECRTISRVSIPYFDVTAAARPGAAALLAELHGKPIAGLTYHPKSIANGQKVAILISDMSGFTRLTKQYGIVHFASLIVVMRTIVRPIFTYCGAIFIQPLADNFSVVFPDTVSAVRAAIRVTAALAKHNKDRLPDFQVRLGGMGISSGDSIEALGPELRGVAAFDAFLLGEDVADDGEILLTEAAYRDLNPRDPTARRAVADNLIGPGGSIVYKRRRVKEEGQPLTFYCVDWTGDVPVAPFDLTFSALPDGDFKDFCKLSAARHAPGITPGCHELAVIDVTLTTRFMTKKTVIMYNLASFEEMTRERGAVAADSLLGQKTSMMARMFEHYGGDVVEPTLIMFNKSDAAFRAAIMFEGLIAAHNESHPAAEHLPLDNIAIHEGSVLFVPGSDIHWGDPVNVASKLSEDLPAPSSQASRLPPLREDAPAIASITVDTHANMFAARVTPPAEDGSSNRQAHLMAGSRTSIDSHERITLTAQPTAKSIGDDRSVHKLTVADADTDSNSVTKGDPMLLESLSAIAFSRLFGHIHTTANPTSRSTAPASNGPASKQGSKAEVPKRQQSSSSASTQGQARPRSKSAARPTSTACALM